MDDPTTWPDVVRYAFVVVMILGAFWLLET